MAPREERIVRLDGRPVDVEVVGAPFRDAGVNAIHVVLQDITARKRAAADLRESEDTFRYVFDNSLLGMSMTRPDGAVRPNAELCRMLGYSASELATLRWQDITPPEDVPMVEAHLRPLLAGESGLDALRQALHAQGRRRGVGRRQHPAPARRGRENRSTS